MKKKYKSELANEIAKQINTYWYKETTTYDEIMRFEEGLYILDLLED